MSDGNGSRGDALGGVVELLDDGGGLTPGDVEALAFEIASAIVDRDVDALEGAAPSLRRALGLLESRPADEGASAAQIAAYLSVVTWALDRMAPIASPAVEPGSRLHRFVDAVGRKSGRTSTELQHELKLDAPTVSRIGSRAIELGLGQKRAIGRRREWELTPRGHHTLDVLQVAERLRAEPKVDEEAIARGLITAVMAARRPSAKIVDTVLKQLLRPGKRGGASRDRERKIKEVVLDKAVRMTGKVTESLITAGGGELPERLNTADLVFGDNVVEVKQVRGGSKADPRRGKGGLVGTVKWHSPKGFGLIEGHDGRGVLLALDAMPPIARKSLVEGNTVEITVNDAAELMVVPRAVTTDEPSPKRIENEVAAPT
jgi:cold shock CspA family protein